VNKYGRTEEKVKGKLKFIGYHSLDVFLQVKDTKSLDFLFEKFISKEGAHLYPNFQVAYGVNFK
jgi:hypothetical protein